MDDNEIARIIGELHENQNGRDCRNVIMLCQSIISETREDNDTAGRLRALRNQGKIAGLKELCDTIESGNPSVVKKS